MVTTTTSLLHDIEEYFSNHNVRPRPKVYDRLDPIGLLIRAHELIGDIEDALLEVKRQDRRRRPASDCDCWRCLDDNDDSSR